MIFFLRLRRDVFRQILVGQEDHGVGVEALDHLHRVRRGAADVDLRLHLGRGVDIGDHRHAREFLAQQPHVLAGDGGGERAAGAQVRDQHGLVGIEDLRGLGHEVHAALHDDVGVDLRRLARELERIADEVGDAVVDFRRLVVVRQDDGVALLLERVDRLHIGREERPLDRRDHGLDALVEMRGLAADLLVPFQRRHRQHAEPARGCRQAGASAAGQPAKLQSGQRLAGSAWHSSYPNMLNLSILGDKSIRHVPAQLREAIILNSSKTYITRSTRALPVPV